MMCETGQTAARPSRARSRQIASTLAWGVLILLALLFFAYAALSVAGVVLWSLR